MLVALAATAALAAHAPELVHDARDRHPFTSVDAPARAVAYARRSGDWIQYWLWSPYNAQDRGIVRTGRHEGDWELVQVRVRDGRAVEAVAAQHSTAERCPLGGRRPVLYVAHGSHALYFRPGVRDRRWPDPNDEAGGDGVRVRPAVVEIDERSPAWMRDPEPWGGSRASWVPGEQGSPRGPAFQGVRWDDPEAFARSARPCAMHCDERGECDGVETAMTASAAGLLGLLAVGLLRRRRGGGRSAT